MSGRKFGHDSSKHGHELRRGATFHHHQHHAVLAVQHGRARGQGLNCLRNANRTTKGHARSLLLGSALKVRRLESCLPTQGAQMHAGDMRVSQRHVEQRPSVAPLETATQLWLVQDRR